MKVSVIFPMAGDGTRFGGTEFKPFIDGTEKVFIELAKEPFNQFKEQFAFEYYFIYRQDQEDTYNVKARLQQYFPGDTLHFCILPSKTSGPAETLARAALLYDLSGAAFVCDCDHAINIQPMVQYLETQSTPDILVPLLEIKETEQANFGKVKISKEDIPLAFYEKEIVPFSDEYYVKGLVGCYFFKEVSISKAFVNYTNISDILPLYMSSHTLGFVTILEAGLFGTPESLIQYRFNLAKRMTFFVDIDGTLLYLPKYVSYDANDAKLLPGAIEKLTEWKQQGHIIVLTTGRESARRDKLISMLQTLKVPYDQLVTNLRSGPRILINDKKPYSEIHQMAKAIQIKRNEGIAHIHVDKTPEILEKLKGGSFANVYLIEKDGVKRVRKYIEKSKENNVHVETLRRQYDDLKRIAYYSPGLVPTLLGSGENESEFFYDMQYLENHKELSTFDRETQKTIVQHVMRKLHDDVYCYSKQINGLDWMNEFLQDKIYSKYKYLESLGETFMHLLNGQTLVINNRACRGIREFFADKNNFIHLLPRTVSPIHGDLTLENILYDSNTNTFYLIDTSGSRYVDNEAMDTAKLLQSFLAKYESWDTRTDIHNVSFDGAFRLPQDVTDTDFAKFRFLFGDDSIAYRSSLLMLACYFIRMTPFLLKKSKDHALFGLLLATYYLSFTKA